MLKLTLVVALSLFLSGLESQAQCWRTNSCDLPDPIYDGPIPPGGARSDHITSSEIYSEVFICLICAGNSIPCKSMVSEKAIASCEAKGFGRVESIEATIQSQSRPFSFCFDDENQVAGRASNIYYLVKFECIN